jgi:hypothetical protein
VAYALDQIVLWGRSFDEYQAMFALSAADLGRQILGCGDGPSSFNSVLTRRGGCVVSVDPIYQFSADEIRGRIHETFEQVMEQTRQNVHEFTWQTIPSVEELARIRMAAMDEFLADYPIGLPAGRYVEGSLPTLPCADRQFELALCSHFLFLYSEHLSEVFHVRSITELCRVAEEVRIFPLLELGSRKSRHLDAVVAHLRDAGLAIRIAVVPYEFQKGGNQMLIACARQ